MILAEELGSPKRIPPMADVAIRSCELGTDDTDRQVRTRSRSASPWVALFQNFAACGALEPPDALGAKIVDFLEANGHPRFSEARLRS